MERNSIRVVNGLIRRVIADRDLYGQAARGVREPGLKAILQESAESLTAIAAELQNEVTATGGRPATAVALHGPPAGHRHALAVERSVDQLALPASGARDQRHQTYGP